MIWEKKIKIFPILQLIKYFYHLTSNYLMTIENNFLLMQQVKEIKANKWMNNHLPTWERKTKLLKMYMLHRLTNKT